MPMRPLGSTELTGHFAKSRATAAGSSADVSVLIRASSIAFEYRPVRNDFQRAFTWFMNAGSVTNLGYQLLTLRVPWYWKPFIAGAGAMVPMPPTASEKL